MSKLRQWLAAFAERAIFLVLYVLALLIGSVLLAAVRVINAVRKRRRD